jgi:hypothetical protein
MAGRSQSAAYLALSNGGNQVLRVIEQRALLTSAAFMLQVVLLSACCGQTACHRAYALQANIP